MFSQEQRVSKAQFQTLLKEGQNVHIEHLFLRFLPLKSNEKQQKNLYAFVVSSKVSKLAVTRNLLKRRGRAIVRKLSSQTRTPFICAFFFKTGSDKMEYIDLEKEIIDLLTKAKLL